MQLRAALATTQSLISIATSASSAIRRLGSLRTQRRLSGQSPNVTDTVTVVVKADSPIRDVSVHINSVIRSKQPGSGGSSVAL